MPTALALQVLMWRAIASKGGFDSDHARFISEIHAHHHRLSCWSHSQLLKLWDPGSASLSKGWRAIQAPAILPSWIS